MNIRDSVQAVPTFATTMNNKGGVGKTVTAINLADILGRDYHKRVVLVDCDGQANATKILLPDLDTESGQFLTTADVLTGDCEQVWSDNLHQVHEGLDMLPSSSGLYDLDLMAIADGNSAPEHMVQFVYAARDEADTDFFIFDCPPGWTVSTVAALLSADEVVIPVTADAFAVDGASAVLRQVRTIQKRRPGVLATALLTQFRNAEVVTEVEKIMRIQGVTVFSRRIRRTDKVPESTIKLSPMADYSPRSVATIDYRAWVRELLGEV